MWTLREGEIMARPKKNVHEDDKLGAVTMSLNNRHKKTLDDLGTQLGVGSRSAAAAKLLSAVDHLMKTGALTAEQIAVASLPKT